MATEPTKTSPVPPSMVSTSPPRTWMPPEESTWLL
jgi:hypothetical protein